MVAPFKPYSKNITIKAMYWQSNNRRWVAYNAYSIVSSGTSQVPPYVNTAYVCHLYLTLKSVNGEDVKAWAVSPGSYGTRVEATNAARARFVGSIGEASQIGSTLTTELKQSYGTVVGGALNLLLSAKAVKAGKLVKAAEILGIAPPQVRRTKVLRTKRGKRITVTKTVLRLPSGREIVKDVGSKWLWWSYGIKPLVTDMYNAMDVLQRPLPWTRVHGSGISHYEFKANTFDFYRLECKVKVAANVRVVNPNLFLANQLGLTNPVQWLNEGIPFSFVIDWFSNLSQVISQMTDFVGLEIADPVTAEHSSVQLNSSTGDSKIRHLYSRSLTMPTAKLRFAYERFQWQRGANAISLLVQFLPKK